MIARIHGGLGIDGYVLVQHVQPQASMQLDAHSLLSSVKCRSVARSPAKCATIPLHPMRRRRRITFDDSVANVIDFDSAGLVAKELNENRILKKTRNH